jgi:hypothetical protein
MDSVFKKRQKGYDSSYHLMKYWTHTILKSSTGFEKRKIYHLFQKSGCSIYSRRNA